MAKSSNKESQAIAPDPIQDAMGSIGWWHIWVCGVIFLLKFPVAWHQMAIIFLAPPVTFDCESPSNLTQCSRDCREIHYDRSVFTNTITMEWDLICEKSQLGNLSQTIFMLGILFGNIFFGAWADLQGRRKPLVVAVMLQVVTGVGSAFSPWFWLFCVLKFLTGIATGGTMVTSFVLVMELIGVKWRELVSVLYQIPFNLGHLTLPLFGYYFRDWRQFQFAVSIPSILLISYYWLVPESPRWLFAADKIDEAAEVLQKAAKQNKLPTESIKMELEKAAIQKHKESSEQPARGNALDLIRTSNMRLKTLIICFNWFVCGLAFFGVAQYVGQVGGDIFTNVAIGAALEIPGTIVCVFMIKYWGRRKSLIATNTLTGIAMLCIAFIPEYEKWAIVTLASTGIVGMSISFPNVYVFAGELFPTVVRNVGIGVASMIARVGSMLAPFVAGLAGTNHWMPPVIFGVIPLIGAVLVIWLPETVGQPLPETIEDAEKVGRKSQSEDTALELSKENNF